MAPDAAALAAAARDAHASQQPEELGAAYAAAAAVPGSPEAEACAAACVAAGAALSPEHVGVLLRAAASAPSPDARFWLIATLLARLEACAMSEDAGDRMVASSELMEHASALQALLEAVARAQPAPEPHAVSACTRLLVHFYRWALQESPLLPPVPPSVHATALHFAAAALALLAAHRTAGPHDDALTPPCAVMRALLRMRALEVYVESIGGLSVAASAGVDAEALGAAFDAPPPPSGAARTSPLRHLCVSTACEPAAVFRVLQMQTLGRCVYIDAGASSGSGADADAAAAALGVTPDAPPLLQSLLRASDASEFASRCAEVTPDAAASMDRAPLAALSGILARGAWAHAADAAAVEAACAALGVLEDTPPSALPGAEEALLTIAAQHASSAVVQAGALGALHTLVMFDAMRRDARCSNVRVFVAGGCGVALAALRAHGRSSADVVHAALRLLVLQIGTFGELAPLQAAAPLLLDALAGTQRDASAAGATPARLAATLCISITAGVPAGARALAAATPDVVSVLTATLAAHAGEEKTAGACCAALVALCAQLAPLSEELRARLVAADAPALFVAALDAHGAKLRDASGVRALLAKLDGGGCGCAACEAARASGAACALRECTACGHGAKPPLLRRCNACGAVAYCGPEHQRAHWKAHKPACKRIAAAKAAAK
jgi:hypothetical protein